MKNIRLRRLVVAFSGISALLLAVPFTGVPSAPEPAASAAAAPPARGARDLAPAQPESVGVSTERLKRLESGMKQVVDDKRIAGIVTMMARHGRVVHFNAVGTKDVRTGEPVQKDSIFRIYSMSKPVTGV